MLFGPSKKALLTNLFNRIRILLMEEIVFTEIGPVSQCIKLLDNIESLDFSSQLQNILKISKIVLVLFFLPKDLLNLQLLQSRLELIELFLVYLVLLPGAWVEIPLAYFLGGVLHVLHNKSYTPYRF